MPESFLHVHAITYDEFPQVCRAELDFAVAYALAGKAAVLGVLDVEEGRFWRNGSGGVHLDWIPLALEHPEAEFEDLLAHAWSMRALKWCRYGGSEIGRTCYTTAKVQYTNSLTRCYQANRHSLERQIGMDQKTFGIRVSELIKGDIAYMETFPGWVELLHRVAGMFLTTDDLRFVGREVKEIAEVLRDSQYMWDEKASRGAYEQLLVGSA